MNKQPSCPRCNMAMRQISSVDATNLFKVSQVLSLSISSALSADSKLFVCGNCPHTYLINRNERFYALVFKHCIGKGGAVKLWDDSSSIYFDDRFQKNIWFGYPLPLDITEERLKTFLLFS